MNTSEPKTIFITGATGPGRQPCRRGSPAREGTASGPWSAPSSDTRWLDRLGRREGPRRPRRRRGAAAGASPGPTGSSTARPRSAIGARSRNSAGSTSTPSASCSTRPPMRKVERFVHVSSLGVYEGRDHHGTDETVPPAANSLDAYTRSKIEAEALALEYHQRARAALSRRPPGLHLRRARPDRPAQAARRTCGAGTFAYFGSGEQALNCIYVKNLVHGIFLAAESPGGRRRGLQPDRWRAGEQDASSSAGSPSWRACGRRRGISRSGSPGLLASLVEGRGQAARGATNPPLVNKARYKFLGLNLDYSIDKARRVLGYQPPFTFERGHRASHGRASPRRPRDEPAVAVRRRDDRLSRSRHARPPSPRERHR